MVQNGPTKGGGELTVGYGRPYPLEIPANR